MNQRPKLGSGGRSVSVRFWVEKAGQESAVFAVEAAYTGKR